MTYQTYAATWRPMVKKHALLYDISLVVGGSLLIALAAQLAIPLVFSPVPITAQTLAVLLIGTLLGSKRGTLCVFAYLTEGAAGLPVFAEGGGSIAHLFGPTGGYLIGFVAAAYLTGFLAERGWDRRIATSILAMTVGTAVIFATGLTWLSFFVGTDRVLLLGLYPFIPGALIKLAIAALLLPTGWKIMGRIRKAADQ